MNVWRLFVLITLVLIAVSCGGGGSATGTSTSTPAIETTLDEQNRITATIPTTGGSLSTTGSDGTIYTLTFAPNSTSTEIQVSLTPVLSISGMGLDQGFIAAVDMSPDGQQFLKAVTLTIELPSPLVGSGFQMGIHIRGETDFTLIPALGNGNIYTIEIDHFSTGGLWEVTPESATQFMIDKFYGPVGIEQTVRRLSSCRDYKFDLLAQKVVDFVASADHVAGYIYTEEATIVPPRQCSGYWVGFEPRGCSSIWELQDAALLNLNETLLYFTSLATEQCSDGEASKEEEAYECIKLESRYKTLTKDINQELCNIKTQCGIASLEIQPESLELNVGEFRQVTGIARDKQGTELPDREISWEDGDTNVAKITDLLSKGPDVEGISPGLTSITLHDAMGYMGLCPKPISYLDGSITVLNSFVTNAETVTVPEGASESFQVKLAYPPDVGVRASVSHASGDSDITVASGEILDFTTSNWDTFQTVLLYAYEDDDDVINGSASIQIVDQRVSPTDPLVETKTVTATEEDNDSPVMYITPDPLCVEIGKTANLSVLGNEFIDLSTIVWSSSDIGVASVDQTGVVTADGNGPARIIADMVVDSEIIAVAFSTINVKDHCVTITRPESCIQLAGSTAFSSVDDTTTLVAEFDTALDGRVLTWASNEVIKIDPSDPDSSLVTSISSGEALVELSVNNVVTQYDAAPISITVAAMPDDYKASWLTIPGDGIATVTDRREILSESQLTSLVLIAEDRCGVSLPELVAGNNYADFNLRGQILGNYFENGESWGFVFDTETCTFNDFRSGITTPISPVGFMPEALAREYAFTTSYTQTSPNAINENGRIVGDVDWRVTNIDINGDIMPRPFHGYHLQMGFVYDLSTGVFDYPMLSEGYIPYLFDDDPDHSGFTDINNNGMALGWFGTGITTGVEFLFDTNLPDGSGVNASLDPAEGANALNDLEHVVGLNWIYSSGEVYQPPLVFSEGTAPQIYNFWKINNTDDVLAHSVPVPYVDKYFVMYTCPFSVENDISANWFENKSDLYGYEELEISCDGLDNDLNGFTDIPLVEPLTDKQSGVCAGTVQKCLGAASWDNDYSNITGYEFPETSCDGRDNDCDGSVDNDIDVDEDGYYRSPLCGEAKDCNDLDPAIFPGAVEVCNNNKDDNCNGEKDEGCGL